MGGTFDPIHIGHLVAASEAAYTFGLDRVIFMPTGRPWQKDHYTDPEDRFMMTSLGAAGHPSFAVSRMELDRKGPTYTADTMQMLREFHGPDIKLYFIAGADAVLKLGTWRKLEELRSYAELIAVTRPGSDLHSLTPESNWPVVHVLEIPGVNVSASEIRARVAEGRPIDFLVPSEVADYIRSRGLFMDSSSRAASG
jgi:nicotinate-nucleotide adenylyltransferase